MPGTLPLDVDDVHRFLFNHVGDDVHDVRVLGQGEWSRAYSFRRGASAFVVRFSRWKEDFVKDRLAHRFAAKALPIPRVTNTGTAPGGYFAIAERAYGESFDDFDSSTISDLFPSVLETLDAIRSAEIAASTGFGLWEPDGNAPYSSWKDYLLNINSDSSRSRTHGWRRMIAGYPDRLAVFDETYRRLCTSVEVCPEKRFLVHADLLNGNVLISGCRVVAVLDWGCALYGDFLYDLAWLSFWSFWCPSLKGFDVEGQARRYYRHIGLDVPNFEDRLRCYKLHIGLDSIAYNSYKERWQFVDEVADQIVAVVS